MRSLALSLAVGLTALQQVKSFGDIDTCYDGETGAATACTLTTCYDGETGAEIDCAILDAELEDESPFSPKSTSVDEWDCDIRSWTRAPDLVPGHQIPGETRVWLNGTGCKDIKSWELGLRLKERAIVKVRNYEVEFPVKPERKPWNATAHRQWTEPDMNDIYTGRDLDYGGYYGNDDKDEKDYQKQMVEYNNAIRNKTLFEVHGQERVVFDTKMPLDIKLEYNNMTSNLFRPFSVKVPLTNFPPVKANSYSGYGTQGKDEQMLNHETMFEYYHLFALANGTILDLPAGRTAFLTEPAPTTLRNTTMTVEEIYAEHDKEDPDHLDVLYIVPEPDVKEPETRILSLGSPKNMTTLGDNEPDSSWSPEGYRNRGPSCDFGNKSTYSIMVTPNVTDLVTGQNITLTLGLRRYGNGTEYPAFLDVSLRTLETVTWAYNYVSNESAYEDLISPPYSHGGGMRASFAYTEKMLSALSEEALLEQRRQSEPYIGSSYPMGGRWPVSQDTIRYDFEEIYETVGDEEYYEFELELPIPYDALPNFESTFSTFYPQLTFELHTTFLCTRKTIKEETKSEDEALDSQWEEWRLPPIKKDRNRDQDTWPSSFSSSMQHTGAMDVIITRPSSLGSDRRDSIKHYLNVTAKAPALSDQVVSSVRLFDEEDSLDLVGLVQRDEDESELKQSRYDLYSSRRQRGPRCHEIQGPGACYRLNSGGGGMHAAKLWQRHEQERVHKRGRKEAGPQRQVSGEEQQAVFDPSAL